MSESRKHGRDPEPTPAPPEDGAVVFGMNVLVRICSEPVDSAVHCPKGCNMVYGKVVAVGDGYDADANQFRPMPAPGSLVAFEEGMETVEGHFYYTSGEEFRVVHVDAVIVAFPPGQ
jgi:hypothetical protein